MQETVSQDSRFLLVHALRGVAAVWVFLFHLDLYGGISLSRIALPVWAEQILFKTGWAGVSIFFVLSGFVIAHSLADKELDGAGFAQFLIRRSVRLDPAYWCSITLAVGAAFLISRLNATAFVPPSLHNILLHVFYVQGLSSEPRIQVVYWTLTYEVQFYAVFAAGCWMVAWLSRRTNATDQSRQIVFVPMFLLAVFSAFFGRDWLVRGLFVGLWYTFFLGVLAYYCGWRRKNPLPFACLCAAVLVGSYFHPLGFGLAAVCTAMLLFVASRSQFLQTGLSGFGWQYCGSISYSLYLTHIPTILVSTMLLRMWNNGKAHSPLSVAITITSCFAIATLFWLAVERPSQNMAKLLFRKPKKKEVCV